MTILLLLGGFVLLIFGGELLVRGAVSIANFYGVSPLLIGLTLVGFGTSTPELMTSVQAALLGSSGIAIGNVIGSNTANILLILGLAALIRPINTTASAFKRDGSILIASTLLLLSVILVGNLSRLLGIVFLILLLAYVVITFFLEQSSVSKSGEVHLVQSDLASQRQQNLVYAVGSLLGGLTLTIVGSQLLINGAIQFARDINISEAIIGLTIVAIGTSLPELITSILAAKRGQGDVAFGNIIGSNIFNILGILGMSALVNPLTVPAQFQTFDIWVMFAATIGFIVFATTGWRVTRIEGGFLLAVYCVYVFLLTIPVF